MRQYLINDAKRITFTAYSMWAFYLFVFVTFLPDLIYWLFEIDTNPKFWTWLQIGLAIFGVGGRLIEQPPTGAFVRRVVIALLAMVVFFAGVAANAQTTERQTMKILEPLVIKWEGQHLCNDGSGDHCAYLDIVNVATVCYGETRGVQLGQRFTERQCRDKLKVRLTDDFRDGLHAYFTNETKQTRLTPERDAAYVSLSYNVGIRGAGKSTATRRLNNGNIAGGCTAIGWWNKAGGRVVRGLVNRRAEEVALCRKGLI